MVSEQEQVQTVQQLYAAFGRGDIPTVLNTLTDDVEWEVAGPSQIAYAGVRRGREQVRQFFQVLGQSVDIQQFEPREFIAQGNHVVVLGFERLRVKSTGCIVDDHWVMVFTLRDGRVVRFREYIDTAAIAAAFETRTGA